jgi:hypothetical protein
MPYPDSRKNCIGSSSPPTNPNSLPKWPDLRIVDRCGCDGDHCATFHTEPKPQGHYKDHRNVMLEPAEGMMILDVSLGRIACVEVLYRPEYVEALDAVIPRG